MTPTARRLVAATVIIVLLLLALTQADANSGGGSVTGDLVGRKLTVAEIEDRAHMLWSIRTAADWDAEDHEACVGESSTLSPTYTRCMVLRSNTRFLYMLRRNCVGISAIASVCKLEVME